MGVAASIGLVLYFVGASVSHLRVSDVKGLGPAVFMLAVVAGALAMRILTLGTPVDVNAAFRSWRQGVKHRGAGPRIYL